MGRSIQGICKTFEDQALHIAQEVERAGYTGLGIQEETLSDLLLNRIQFEHDDRFFTRKFTRKEEGNITGADWLWCIGEPGSWITFAVQAKIANPKTGTVNYLHYRNGTQCDLLIDFSKQFGFIPKYSIYGTINEEIEFFARKTEELRDIPLKQWSFSMVSPKYIKGLSTRSKKHISNVLQFSIPWAHAFCNETFDTGALANGITRNLENIYWVFENEFRRQRNQKTKNNYKRITWENPQPSRLITKDVPLPVLYLLTKQSFTHKIPISNVSIFSTIPVQHALERELMKIEGQRSWKNYPKTFERAVSRIYERRTTYWLPEGR